MQDFEQDTILRNREEDRIIRLRPHVRMGKIPLVCREARYGNLFAIEELPSISGIIAFLFPTEVVFDTIVQV